MADETENKNAGFRILGKRIGDIPCFRDSYFYGISTGIFSGFLYFMVTSRIQKATTFGMGAFAVSTLSYWAYCRVNYSREMEQALELKEYLEQHVGREGRNEMTKENLDIVTV